MLSLAVAAALSPTALPAELPDRFTAGSVSVDGRKFEYQLLVPDDVEPETKLPLVLFLHGAGERGSDNQSQLVHFPAPMATKRRRTSMPCFVLAPQCPSGERWSSAPWGEIKSRPIDPEPTVPLQAAIEALAEVVREHPVDTDRIYLTGLSMGGYGALDLAQRHPDWFAAVVPVCGGGDERQAARLAGIPISIWHGDADRAVPVERSRQMVAALKELGETPEYNELRGVGHNAWDFAYDDAGGCLKWMFAQRRDPGRRLAAAARLMAKSLAPDERIAFLGDSITQAGARPNGYVDRLRSVIAKAHPRAEVIPAGISGNRIPDLLAREQVDVRAKRPTIVFTYIGINDVWHSKNGKGTPLEEYRYGLRGLLGGFERAGATNVVATPTLIGEAPEGENELDEMLSGHVAAARAVGSEDGCTLCDLHAAFRAHERIFNAAGASQGCLTTDGVHLNDAGNVLVATEVALAIRAAAEAR
ncbi:MAG: GDSL-type esterase/lipase family protein [Planctomycetota bacterium]